MNKDSKKVAEQYIKLVMFVLFIHLVTTVLLVIFKEPILLIVITLLPLVFWYGIFKIITS